MAAADSPRRRLAGWVSRWWDGSAGPAGTALRWLLSPAELGYRMVIGIRNEAYDRALLASASAPVPVISVGNLGVGGSGKTPFAAWVASRFATWGYSPAIALRGYGRDEVMVHQTLNPHIPAFADAKRIRAVEAAAASGCGVVILDDGFQHRQLERDLDLLLVSADAWRGSRRMLPCGPWREGAGAARRADLVIAVRKSSNQQDEREVEREFHARAREPSVVSCRIEPSHLERLNTDQILPLGQLAGRQVFAVAALAAPASFVANLESAGASVELAAFPDHHDFSEREATALMRRAAGRPIALTLKDAVKLRSFWRSDEAVFVLHQAVRIERGEELLDAALHRIASMVRG